MVIGRDLTRFTGGIVAAALALWLSGCILDIGRSQLQLPSSEDASEDVSSEDQEGEEDGGPGPLTWAKTIGSTDNSEPHCIQATSDGKFIATGYADSSVWAARHVAVVKLDAAGNPDWLWTIGGMQDDKGIFVDETDAGTYRVVGWTGSGGAGSMDALVLELQEGGSLMSQKAYGTGREETVTDAAATADGGLVLCGRRVPSDTDLELWVMKLSSAGSVEWATATYYGSAVRAFAVEEAPDGGFLVAGSVNHPGSDDDILIFKLNATGSPLWASRLARYPDGEDKAKSMAMNPDGSFDLVGHVCTVDNNRCDLWVGRFDPDARLIDQAVYGGTELDFGLDVVPTQAGGLLLFGSTGSFGSGGEDLWLLGLDGNLDAAWQKTYGGPLAECGESDYNLKIRVDEVETGGFILACGTRSYGVDAYDAWFLRVAGDGSIAGDCPEGMIAESSSSRIEETGILEDVNLPFTSLTVEETVTELQAYYVPYESLSQCQN